ncbi:hypothetical protein [Solihabitans fulvus]|uniref:hypothetical protein n=1 Tax=Solihabitans fulvus TaxID=1892852 RepID=UPI001661C7BF|nr:hypothetical protein [Solihabitans fulvus]
MTSSEPASMTELIEDCADIPPAVRRPESALPLPRASAGWRVTEACEAQVRDMDNYGS